MDKILILDDELELLEIMNETLVDLGFEVFPFSTINSAKEFLNSSKVDLILCDMRLQNETGIDFLKKLRNENITTPFIFITGFPDISLADAHDLGATDIFQKPIEFKKYVQRILDIILISKMPNIFYSQVKNKLYDVRHLYKKVGGVMKPISNQINISGSDLGRGGFAAFVDFKNIRIGDIFSFILTIDNNKNLIKGLGKCVWMVKSNTNLNRKNMFGIEFFEIHSGNDFLYSQIIKLNSKSWIPMNQLTNIKKIA